VVTIRGVTNCGTVHMCTHYRFLLYELCNISDCSNKLNKLAQKDKIKKILHTVLISIKFVCVPPTKYGNIVLEQGLREIFVLRERE
jgi:hypothetical protein